MTQKLMLLNEHSTLSTGEMIVGYSSANGHKILNIRGYQIGLLKFRCLLMRMLFRIRLVGKLETTGRELTS